MLARDHRRAYTQWISTIPGGIYLWVCKNPCRSPYGIYSSIMRGELSTSTLQTPAATYVQKSSTFLKIPFATCTHECLVYTLLYWKSSILQGHGNKVIWEVTFHIATPTTSHAWPHLSTATFGITLNSQWYTSHVCSKERAWKRGYPTSTSQLPVVAYLNYTHASLAISTNHRSLWLVLPVVRVHE